MENSQKAGFFRPVDNSLSLSISLSLFNPLTGIIFGWSEIRPRQPRFWLG